ncbi:MAG: type VI secretion system baseplate subunit TssG [Ottowia sp.]|uniref:type VI secretion system baseplate subunit TssG n=1 Tax=unclassified Ottowia TaxID=2645081 RepID=UPI003C30ADC0
MRKPADPVGGMEAAGTANAVAEQLNAWAAEPWRWDYFAVMRRLETLSSPAPRWGQAALPRDESVRVGQEPSLAFPPASFSRFELQGAGGRARLRQLFFGYLGPNGPLPIHMSDFIRERALNWGDRTWLAFLDTFAHRFSLHFYRAWLQARPAVTLDRPGDDTYRRWAGSLIGIGSATRQQRDEIFDDARLHFSGWLARRVHNAESIEAVLQRYFGVPVRVERWVGHWMSIEPAEQTRLGSPRHAAQAASRMLGGGAVLGSRVWDRQHRIRIHLGPLSLAQYRAFLPTGNARAALQRWMQQLLGDELQWDAELVLKKEEVPPTRLGAPGEQAPRLGWLSWLGDRPRTQDARDVRVPA